MTPMEPRLYQKEEGDKRAGHSKLETEKNCVNKWFCHLWQICVCHRILIDFPHSTQKGLKMSTATVNATIWDTLARKDVGQCSEHGHNQQFYDMSYTFVECNFSMLLPPAIFWEKREMGKKSVWSLGKNVADWSQRLKMATPGLKWRFLFCFLLLYDTILILNELLKQTSPLLYFKRKKHHTVLWALLHFFPQFYFFSFKATEKLK